VITAVQKDAPADGELQTGDIIRAVDGVEIDTVDAAQANISKVPPGDKVELTIERKGKQVPVTLTTEPSPDDESKSRRSVKEKRAPD